MRVGPYFGASNSGNDFAKKMAVESLKTKKAIQIPEYTTTPDQYKGKSATELFEELAKKEKPKYTTSFPNRKKKDNA